MFIEYYYYCVGAGECGHKPTTAELEPRRTSVWIHAVNAAGRDHSGVI